MKRANLKNAIGLTALIVLGTSVAVLSWTVKSAYAGCNSGLGRLDPTCPGRPLGRPQEDTGDTLIDHEAEMNANIRRRSGSVLNFCNKTSDKTISAAYTSFDGSNGWQSHGWYQVPPSSCRRVSIGRAYNGDVFIYGQHNGGETFWGGQDASFCVSNQAFSIPNSDKNCSGDSSKSVGMSKFSIRTGVNNWSFN